MASLSYRVARPRQFLISVLKLFTPQITGKITGSILAGRGQTSALGGGGRERPSGREPPPAKLLRPYQTAQGSVSGPTSACRQASAKKRNQPPTKPTPHIRMPRLLSTSAESTTITTIPRTIRKPTPTACAGVRPLSASARRESVVLPELVSAHRPQEVGSGTSPGR
jgi:hypothetical protein